MRQARKPSASSPLRAAMLLSLGLTLTACATSPAVSPPVPKPPNVTVSESESSDSWRQRVRDYLSRAKNLLAGLTLD